MEEKCVLICEDSIDGIFTGIYDGWKLGGGGVHVELCMGRPGQAELFSRYETVGTDPDKAAKVARTIRRKLGPEVYEQLCYAACSTDADKGTCIYYALKEGFANGHAHPRVLENLTNPYILKISKMQLAVWHEMHRFLGFVRFREIQKGVLFAAIHPQHSILPLIAPHFADRLPRESWVIYDEGRQDALLHPAGGDCYIRRQAVISSGQLQGLAHEEKYAVLWKEFCRSITVPERQDPRRQQQNLPKKYRQHLPEFC